MGHNSSRLISDNSNTDSNVSSNSQVSRHRRMELGRLNHDNEDNKRQKIWMFGGAGHENSVEHGELETSIESSMDKKVPMPLMSSHTYVDECPKFGLLSICGRRRYMEDAVAIHPWFCSKEKGDSSNLHFFGLYDGHGCSHVAMRCKDRMHQVVKEELGRKAVESIEWKTVMNRSFSRIDGEVIMCKEEIVLASGCGCQLQSPQSDVVGSTAVVALVMPTSIVVANCGDSRAILCRDDKVIPLSRDHKPDVSDELLRIQGAGGRVICLDIPRVQGILAMSRAIGDKYLKPCVSCEPEVTVVNRTREDEFVIIASDGLWDVVSNEDACRYVGLFLRPRKVARVTPEKLTQKENNQNWDEACAKAATFLTQLALGRRSTDNVSVVVIDLKRPA